MDKEIIQENMDIFYKYWQLEENTKKSQDEIHQYFIDNNQRVISMSTKLGNLNYQIENGGVSQYESNGYLTSDLDDIIDYSKKAVTIFKNNNIQALDGIIEFVVWLENLDNEAKQHAAKHENIIKEMHRLENSDDENAFDEYNECESQLNNECEWGNKLDDEFYNGFCIGDSKYPQLFHELIVNYDMIQNAQKSEIDENKTDRNCEVVECLRYPDTVQPKTEGLRYPDTKVNLIGTDGNIFNIIGKVSNALKNSKVSTEEIIRFNMEITKCDSYDSALNCVMKWVNVS